MMFKGSGNVNGLLLKFTSGSCGQSSEKERNYKSVLAGNQQKTHHLAPPWQKWLIMIYFAAVCMSIHDPCWRKQLRCVFTAAGLAKLYYSIIFPDKNNNQKHEEKLHTELWSIFQNFAHVTIQNHKPIVKQIHMNGRCATSDIKALKLIIQKVTAC